MRGNHTYSIERVRNISINRGNSPWIPAFAGMTLLHSTRHSREGGNPAHYPKNVFPRLIEKIRGHMEMQVIIRNAGEQDLDRIIELWKELMDFHKIHDPHFSRSSDGHEKFMEFISGHIASETSKVLVAEHNGNIVGYCLASIPNYPPVFENKEYGSIDDLAVTESYRRTGVGEKICQEIQKWFIEHNIQRIELRVAVTNEVSTSFWRKMGYRPYIEVLYKEI